MKYLFILFYWITQYFNWLTSIKHLPFHRALKFYFSQESFSYNLVQRIEIIEERRYH